MRVEDELAMLRAENAELRPLIDKTEAAVKDRLTNEITYRDHRAEELRLREQAGRSSSRLNSIVARQRAEELEARLEACMAELRQGRHLLLLPPAVMGGVLIVPRQMIDRLRGTVTDEDSYLGGRSTTH